MKNSNETWKEINISKLLSIGHGKDQKEVVSSNGKYNIYGSGGVIGKTDMFLYDKPSVLIGRKGTIDKPIYVEKPFWTVDTMFYTRINESVNPKWLYYYFQTINWRKYNEASSIPSLSASTIGSIKVKTPTFEEQRKIAYILSTWDEAIDLQNKLIIEKKNFLSSLALSLVKNHKSLAKFESLWETVSLSDVFSERKEYGYEDEDLELYSLTIEDGVTAKTDRYNREFLVKGDKKKYKVTKHNDLVFNPQNLRYGAIALNNNEKPVLLSPIYATLELKDTNKYDIEYFNFLLTSNEMIKYYNSIAEGTLVERMTVKPEVFLKQEFTIPPIEEQRRISQVLIGLRDEIILLENELKLKKLQKQGLMQQLLTGKIRVNVN